MSWLLDQEPVPRQYTLRQRGQMLYVEAEAPSPTTSGLETPGSLLGPISATTRYVQVQQVDPEGVWQPVEQGIPLAAGGVVRLHTDQQELTIDSIIRPEWAESIGRDAQGLYVTWAQGQRRAYWVPPGQYSVRNRAGERLGVLPLTRGHWSDEDAGLTHLREGLQQPSWANDYGLDAYGLYAGFSVQGAYQRMRWITPGEFLMGSPGSEPERFHDEIQHRVILSRGFWLAETACTQALWQAVMGNNPSQFEGPDLPWSR